MNPRKKNTNFSTQKKSAGGYAAIITVLGISALSLVIVTSLTSIISTRQKTARNLLYSMQSYYAAEAGIEDALLRNINGSIPAPTGSYTITVGGNTAEVTLENDMGGNIIIQARGDSDNRIRTLETTISIDTEEASFFYGAQAGNGGFQMDNNSTVNGNIYSNGSLEGSNGATVTGDVIIAGHGDGDNRVYNVNIGGNATAPKFLNCSVAGDITYVLGGGIQNCSAGGSSSQQDDSIPSADMPISQEQIDEWKQNAQNSGTIIDGDYTPPDDSTQTIGPGVITGNMILQNNQTIIIAGTVYVQGHIDLGNNVSIELVSGYGSTSGILVADDWIEINNNASFSGSGQPGSYVITISNSTCDGSDVGDCSSANAAIDINNNADGAIFYAANGMLFVHNNVNLTQATADKIFLDNNATINYEIGLQSALFSGGPGANYTISNWQEVE